MGTRLGGLSKLFQVRHMIKKKSAEAHNTLFNYEGGAQLLFKSTVFM